MFMAEIGKLIKLKVFLIPLVLVIGYTIYVMAEYGEFGYDFSSSMISISEKDGEILSGHEGYERNKAIAESYVGIVSDEYLDHIHEDCVNSTYVDQGNGEKFYNSTYRYFQKVFFIEKEEYLSYDHVFGDVNGKIKYGFTGDWDAYIHIIDCFFLVFLLFIIIFAAPLFSYEKECGTVEMVAVACKGGKNFLKYKMKSVAIFVNSLMLLLIGMISLIHFSQYGFDNFDISIQCGSQYKYINSCIDCNMAQVSIFQLIAGIVGSNIVLMLTILISMLSASMLGAFVAGCAIIFPFHYTIMNFIIQNHAVNMIFSMFPINSISIITVVGDAHSWMEVVFTIMVYIIEVIVAIWSVNKMWSTRRFFLSK